MNGAEMENDPYARKESTESPHGADEWLFSPLVVAGLGALFGWIAVIVGSGSTTLTAYLFPLFPLVMVLGAMWRQRRRRALRTTHD